MDLLHESLVFGVKGFIVFVTVTATFSVTAMIIGWVTRRGRGAPSRMSVSPLNERYEDLGDALRSEVLDLMRTQVLKNALIVPTGAKGGLRSGSRTQPKRSSGLGEAWKGRLRARISS